MSNAIQPNIKNEWTVRDRPLRICDVKGNDFKRETLLQSLSKGVFPQLVLFTGEAGVSKTTLALISALSLQCLNRNEGEPCLECENCKGIIENLIFDDTTREEKTAMGVTLWNMAIKSSVQDADEMIEILSYEQDSQYPHRVFILEEPQNMSIQCQDRLLLAFENLPSKTHIIMCTTDEYKLRPAFASRAIHLNLEVPGLNDVVEILEDVAIRHQVKIPKDKIALKMIAQSSNCVPRDSIKLFQLLAETGDINLHRVTKWLGEISTEYYIQFYKIVKYDISEIIDFVIQLGQDEVNYKDFLKGLREFTKDLLLMKYNKSVWKYSKEMKDEIKEILEDFSYKDFLSLNRYMASIQAITESQAQSELLALAFKISEESTLKAVTNEEKEIRNENIDSAKQYSERKKEELIKGIGSDANRKITSMEDLINIMDFSNPDKNAKEVIKFEK